MRSRRSWPTPLKAEPRSCKRCPKVLRCSPASFLLNVAHNAAVRRAQLARLRQRQAALAKDAAALQKQAALLNQPATFAQGARLQRLSVAREKEADVLRVKQARVLGSALCVPPMCILEAASTGIGLSLAHEESYCI